MLSGLRTIPITPDTCNRLAQLSKINHENFRIKKRVQALVDIQNGEGLRIVAEKHGINRITLQYWRDRAIRWEYYGIVNSVPKIGRSKNFTTPIANNIRDIINNNNPPRGNRWTITNIADMLGIGRSIIYHTIIIHNISISRFNKISEMGEKLLPMKISDFIGYILCCQYKVFAFLFETRIQISEYINKVSKSSNPIQAINKNYNIHRLEMMTLIREIVQSASSIRKPDTVMKESLLFLDIIEKRIGTDRPILLFMSPSTIESKKNVAIWLDRHPRFKIVISSSDDDWIDEITEALECIESQYQNRIALQFEYFSTRLIEQSDFFRSPLAIFGSIMPGSL